MCDKGWVCAVLVWTHCVILALTSGLAPSRNTRSGSSVAGVSCRRLTTDFPRRITLASSTCPGGEGVERASSCQGSERSGQSRTGQPAGL